MIDLELSEYERLPESVKAFYTQEEYRWLPDEMKRNLIQRETEPEVE